MFNGFLHYFLPWLESWRWCIWGVFLILRLLLNIYLLSHHKGLLPTSFKLLLYINSLLHLLSDSLAPSNDMRYNTLELEAWTGFKFHLRLYVFLGYLFYYGISHISWRFLNGISILLVFIMVFFYCMFYLSLAGAGCHCQVCLPLGLGECEHFPHTVVLFLHFSCDVDLDSKVDYFSFSLILC